MGKISSARFRIMAGAVVVSLMGLISLTKWQVGSQDWVWYMIFTDIVVIGVVYTTLIGTEINLSVGVKKGLPLVILSVSEYLEEAPPGWVPSEGDTETHNHLRVVLEVRTPSSWE
jgi:hypothetical protein